MDIVYMLNMLTPKYCLCIIYNKLTVTMAKE
jgi:hypothetical protein